MMAMGSNSAEGAAAAEGESGRINKINGVVDSVEEAKPAIDISGLPMGQSAEMTQARNFELWPVNDCAIPMKDSVDESRSK